MQPSPVAPSLRERKKQRVRMDLTRAAVALARDQGYDATTVEQIAAAADVSPRTFFRYFAAKEDVLFGDIPELLERLQEQLADAGDEEDPVETVKRVLRESVLNWTVFDDPALEVECARLWREEAAPRRRYIEVVLEWEAAIAEFLGRRWELPADSLRCRITAMSLIAVTRVSIDQGGQGRAAASTALDEGWALLAHGIRNSYATKGGQH